MTIVMDSIVVMIPLVWYNMITDVMDPGPASRGNARGTTPESSRRMSYPNLHAPWVSSSIDTINRSIPPAIMKLNTSIPKMAKICVPAIANTKSNMPAVTVAVWDIDLRSLGIRVTLGTKATTSQDSDKDSVNLDEFSIYENPDLGFEIFLVGKITSSIPYLYGI